MEDHPPRRKCWAAANGYPGMDCADGGGLGTKADYGFLDQIAQRVLRSGFYPPISA